MTIGEILKKGKKRVGKTLSEIVGSYEGVLLNEMTEMTKDMISEATYKHTKEAYDEIKHKTVIEDDKLIINYEMIFPVGEIIEFIEHQKRILKNLPLAVMAETKRIE